MSLIHCGTDSFTLRWPLCHRWPKPYLRHPFSDITSCSHNLNTHKHKTHKQVCKTTVPFPSLHVVQLPFTGKIACISESFEKYKEISLFPRLVIFAHLSINLCVKKTSAQKVQEYSMYVLDLYIFFSILRAGGTLKRWREGLSSIFLRKLILWGR